MNLKLIPIKMPEPDKQPKTYLAWWKILLIILSVAIVLGAVIFIIVKFAPKKSKHVEKFEDKKSTQLASEELTPELNYVKSYINSCLPDSKIFY